LSFTLSFGGVDFCLSSLSSPDEEGDAGAAWVSPEYGGSVGVPIVSVKKTKASSVADGGGIGGGGGGEIVAELSGFSGTLRISLASSPSTIAAAASASRSVGDHRDATPAGDGVDATGFSRSADPIPPVKNAAPILLEETNETSAGSRDNGVNLNKRISGASRWKKLRKRVHSVSLGDASVDNRSPSLAVDSMEIFDESRSKTYTDAGSVDGSTSNQSDGNFSLEDKVDLNESYNESELGEDSRAARASVFSTEPFQHLLRLPSMSDEIPPPPTGVSPFHGRDRPFRKIAIAAMSAKRARARAAASSNVGVVEGPGRDVRGGNSSNEHVVPAGLIPPAQLTAVAFERDIGNGNDVLDGEMGELAVRPRDAADAASSALILVTSGAPRIIRSTPLHRACANSNSTLSRLRSILESDPGAAFVKDEKGKLPIHIIAENESLLQYRRRRDDVGTFIRDLSDCNPTGFITEDDSGNVPLVPIIRHWIQNTYRMEFQSGVASKSSVGGAKHSAVRLALGFARYSRHRHVDTPDQEQGGEVESAQRVPSLISDTADTAGVFVGLFPDVYVPPVVEWALVMLSLTLDNFGGPLSRERGTRLEQLNHRQALAERVATIPLFIKTVLLVEDSETRNRLLELSVVRRAMLCTASVDHGWGVVMLQKRGAPSRRMVDYFKLVSKLDVSDYVGKDRDPRQADYVSFNREKGALFDAIQRYEEILPSLLILPVKELEQVSRSRVVWQVLDNTISRPFVIGIVSIDFVLHFTLILAFRIEIAKAGQAYQDPGGGEHHPIDDIPIGNILIFCIGLHQLMRKASEAAYLYLISPAVFRSYFLDFWTIADVSSTILVWLSVVQIHNTTNPNSILIAVAMVLLWFRFLGVLKAINMHLATYILSVTEIVRDIKWYLLLLAICIIMFADMIQIITFNSNQGEYCTASNQEQSGTREDFCSENLLNSYLRMYAVLVGDFEFDDYRTTPFISTLFILFTLIGVIVLLNVLIAIVSDSYEKSLVRSQYLFGRARVSFAAQHAALESFLMQPRNRIYLSDFSNWRAANFLLLLGRIGRWAILLSLLVTSIVIDFFLVATLLSSVGGNNTASEKFLLILLFILVFILNIAIVDVFQLLCLKSSICAPHQNHATEGRFSSRIFGCFSCMLNYCLKFVSQKLFGIKLKEDDTEVDATSEWEGWFCSATFQVMLD